MTTSEKTARISWLVYLVLAAPLVVLCAIAFVLLTYGLFDPRPPEEFRLSTIRTLLLLISSFLVSAFWILGIFQAHRFNSPWLALVPFVAQLIPLTIFAAAVGAFSGMTSWDPWYIYCLLSSLPLVVGIASVIISALKTSSIKEMP